MRRTLRPSVVLALVALIGLVGVGCGSNAASRTGTASSSGPDSGGGDKNAGDQDRAVKFAECIRAHGYPDFPDPDANGDFTGGISVSSAVWRKAVNACKDLQPPGSFSGKRSPQQQSAALRFAECMRENGVKDFPDPVNGDPLIDTTKIPSANAPGGMTIIRAARDKCRSVLDLALGGQG